MHCYYDSNAFRRLILPQNTKNQNPGKCRRRLSCCIERDVIGVLKENLGLFGRYWICRTLQILIKLC